MGPCFISTEGANTCAPPYAMARFNGAVLHQHGRQESLAIDVWRIGLQWGRASSARKAFRVSHRVPEQSRLQWGRASSARKAQDEPVVIAINKKLQWGRASSARKALKRFPT